MNVLRSAFVLVLIALVGSVGAAGVDSQHLKKYGSGIITDYSDMRSGSGVEWAWTAPGVRLADHRFEVKSVENLTDIHDRRMMSELEDALPGSLQRVGAKDSGAAVLHVEAAVYWAQRANRSKWFIPYAGLHLAQAGVGLELVVKNAAGEIVAKIRHSGREGDKLEDAAAELIDDITAFFRNN
jgi:hypothetical protein